MTHEYSKFKNKNIPYAKVGRRVFNSLFDAETFCTEHSLDVNSAIEYRDDLELKNNIQTIAQYQKAILQECLDRLKAPVPKIPKIKAASEPCRRCKHRDRFGDEFPCDECVHRQNGTDDMFYPADCKEDAEQ